MLRPDTKRILAESLEELLENKELKNITVNEITDHCGAARSTFYKHFKDKYDLVNWIYEDFLTGYLCIQFNTELDEFMIQLKPLEFIYSKRKFFKKICKYSGQNSFGEFVFQVTRKRAVEIFLTAHRTEKIPEKLMFFIDYMSAGTAYSIINWIEYDFPVEPEKMAEYLSDSTPVRYGDISDTVL